MNQANATEVSASAGDEAGIEERSTDLRVRVVDEQSHGQRLDRQLVQLAPEFSRSYLQTLIAAGHVRVAGKAVVTAARRISAGDTIEVVLVPSAQTSAFRPEPMPLQVVYEDEHLLVIDKPAGLVVHPAPGNWSGTLLNGLLAYHVHASELPRAGIVHRLDKDTSGLMVVAKSLPAMTELARAIAAREIRREYLAIAHGTWMGTDGIIDKPIGRDPVSRVRMAVVASGRPSRTDVALNANLAGYCALRCTLQTGRTHQIRVHLASIGHPLVADALYGGANALGMARQALHAVRLSFAHPVLGGELSFDGALPSDFSGAWGHF